MTRRADQANRIKEWVADAADAGVEPTGAPPRPADPPAAPIRREAADPGVLGGSPSRSDRVRAGQAAARARGVRIGRPPMLDVDGSATVHELARAGLSLRAIAGALGVSVGAVRRVLGRATP